MMTDADRPIVPPRDPDWFVIQSGKESGQPHLVGWILAATYGVCPRCLAMVPDRALPSSNPQRSHERWHARTDYPVPASVLNAADPAWRDMYRHPDGQP